MIEQYKLRFDRLNVRWAVWYSGMRPSEVPANLFIILETTQIPAMRFLLEQLVRLHRTARVIIDEAHVIVGHTFRQVTSTLSWLGTLGVQIVLQSATIPPTMTSHLCKLFGVTDWDICRATTTRPEISYRVETVDDVDSRLGELFHQRGTRKALVYCSSRDAVKHVCTVLNISGCTSYDTTDIIDGHLERLRTGAISALSSTSILGVALDVPDIELVIHYGHPWDALGYIQETGRAGRAPGAIGTAIMLLPKKDPTTARPIDQPDFVGAALLRFIVKDNRLG